jgi:hypothetical protein
MTTGMNLGADELRFLLPRARADPAVRRSPSGHGPARLVAGHLPGPVRRALKAVLGEHGLAAGVTLGTAVAVGQRVAAVRDSPAADECRGSPQADEGLPTPGHPRASYSRLVQVKRCTMRYPHAVTFVLSVPLVSVALTACSSSPGNQAVKGQILGGTSAASTVYSATGGGRGICAGAVGGTQVIVKGPSGTLLATTNLQKDASATSALGLPSALTGSSGQMGIYTFAASIPAGNGPYTIDVVGVSSLVVSAKDLGHLQLTC